MTKDATLPNGIRVRGDLGALLHKLEQDKPRDRAQALRRHEEEAIILHLLMDEAA